jgi:hypothetical protein
MSDSDDYSDDDYIKCDKCGVKVELDHVKGCVVCYLGMCLTCFYVPDKNDIREPNPKFAGLTLECKDGCCYSCVELCKKSSEKFGTNLDKK